ncbi:hypothetical protein CO009_01800 [Candidatus Shapirobacteria bacterium CG_4_8_14_3_um_filter_35_11]|uniref:Uncharacterized protein n=6 Tax=Candidatus Shapironibacteriota TaxID=1752721 RepID=A0A1J5HQA7_9BACT|nr:MAG: hypothetical protein AUK05_01100 [Candidatus Shapirobacteria bacterium CG2_30_35_20]PIV07854.1 MAG: hypothetical protein COS53_00220 [Candidatus Shapirobacteria bacterium CG03_land_8_20_14_0_80_35_14]PIX67979.1 MAG: hypothetical protein COZ41_02180 [Candidatus Shapirobacteria bacterium CG_4_10_14_3_um_filter_35_13]PJA51143.1 MAG: hypothetical protein CO168_01385 [Candidatus Shapirobacteria bacterium CG_4_9_14_3_um_filter_36_12]PJC80511.1 MAG: hypothetical protein CO009_01800 [Candidatus
MNTIEVYEILAIVSGLLLYEIYKYQKGWGIGRRVFIFTKPKTSTVVNRFSLLLSIIGLAIIEILIITLIY